MDLVCRDFGEISSDGIEMKDNYTDEELYSDDNQYGSRVSLKDFRNYSTQSVDYNMEKFTIATLEYADGETATVTITDKKLAYVLAQLDKAKASKKFRLAKGIIKCY